MGHFRNDIDNDAVFLAMDKIWLSESNREIPATKETEALYRKLVNDPQFKKARTRRIKLWPRIAVAASVLITLSAGLWFYAAHQQISGKNDISPGRNTATLTLTDGKHIKLSDAKTGIVINASTLTYNDGTEINKTKPTPLLTITTPPGGTYQVLLSDGTKIWLNAASVLKFPSTFTESKYRKVEVMGEAYFEVAKDRAKPFIVTSDQQEVEVLGTHFNINSYADENSIKTTLLEGSVRVSIRNSSISGFLKPGMQSSLTTKGINIKQLEHPEKVISWQNGYFTFNRENLDQIMRKVSRWYNVKIIYRDQQIKSIPFSGTIPRYVKVSEVLKMLELTEKVKFTIDDKNIIANRK
ncbi:FecR family protein [Chryseobacterium sp. MEBOG07]|uniref:FecR family protein n=1 Tax=Chryseobacterium sp. MEBOG07 TaxID=2879939 RepID=UPI001F457B7E|nr:FecR family protein [Chryseobacterium sp. MEBOG07]UKB78579.1 FecR family protein [Chryseobacterium sp. MEBOG07]